MALCKSCISWLESATFFLSHEISIDTEVAVEKVFRFFYMCTRHVASFGGSPIHHSTSAESFSPMRLVSESFSLTPHKVSSSVVKGHIEKTDLQEGKKARFNDFCPFTSL